MHSLRDPNRSPPGALLPEDVLSALAMTPGEFAHRLGVSPLTVSDLLHDKRALSVEMAARLGKLLGTAPESWLAMQAAVELRSVDADCLAGVEPIKHEGA